MTILNFLSKLCNCIPIKDNINNYNSAGCIFINNSLVLSGYQKKKTNYFISGIGGKKQNEDVNYIHTAIREMIEELFEIYIIPNKLLEELYEIKPLKINYSNKYVNIVYSFDHLDEMLEILYSYNLKSPLYISFPSCLNELIFNRKINNNEVTHLCLLPFVKTEIKIDKNFIKDIFCHKSSI